MHDANRENASSIAKNIQFDYKTYMNNKYFNKVPVKDVEIPY